MFPYILTARRAVGRWPKNKRGEKPGTGLWVQDRGIGGGWGMGRWGGGGVEQDGGGWQCSQPELMRYILPATLFWGNIGALPGSNLEGRAIHHLHASALVGGGWLGGVGVVEGISSQCLQPLPCQSHGPPWTVHCCRRPQTTSLAPSTKITVFQKLLHAI